MDKPALKDHKQIGQELELFFINDIAPGAPFWLPKGMVIFKELEKYIRELTSKAGYQETSTPIMVKTDLFRQSGHASKFGLHNMYNVSLWEDEEIKEIGKEIKRKQEDIKKEISRRNEEAFEYPITVKIKGQNISVFPLIIVKNKETGDFGSVLPSSYSLKPMNCPESTIIYRFKTRSYKDLPLRFSEIGRLNRREKEGEVNGLLRVRQITMDDAHIYATEDQIFDEVSNILDMMIAFYKNFGFEYEFRFATRPEQKAGKDEMWDKAEKNLEEVLKKKGIKAGDKKGDGAFYGPKIDIHIKDSLGREWQLATVQLDFHQPEAFNLSYVDNEGKEIKPVMIHRAIFGSFERFIAILTEQYQGAFPLWLSPVQVMVIPIADRHNEYASSIVQTIESQEIRVEMDARSERLQAKIRDAALQKVPYLGIIGDREVQSSKFKVQSYDESLISVRTRNGKDLGQIKLSEFITRLKEEIDKKI